MFPVDEAACPGTLSKKTCDDVPERWGKRPRIRTGSGRLKSTQTHLTEPKAYRHLEGQFAPRIKLLLGKLTQGFLPAARLLLLPGKGFAQLLSYGRVTMLLKPVQCLPPSFPSQDLDTDLWGQGYRHRLVVLGTTWDDQEHGS